jgi:hypothetical protein
MLTATRLNALLLGPSLVAAPELLYSAFGDIEVICVRHPPTPARARATSSQIP